MPMARRIPKRGFKNFTRKVLAPVNLAKLEKLDADVEITEAVLRAAGLVKGNFDGVKILGNGEITKKLTIKVTAFSATAKEKIVAAGGSCEAV